MAQHPLKDGLHPGQITTTSSWDTGHADTNVNLNANSNLRPHPPGFGSSGPGKTGSEIFPPDGTDLVTTPDPLHALKEQFLKSLLSFHEDPDSGGSAKVDLDSPHLRHIFSDGLLTVIVLFFVALAIVSFIGNIIILLLIIKQKLYKESINLCLANIIIIHLVQVIVILPLCLVTRLVHNWVLGQFLCYMLPVITDLPSHLCILTLFTVNLIRYGKLLFPTHSRPTPGVLLPLCWVVSLLLVLPYLSHITHVYIKAQGPRFFGGQMCLHQEDDYIQGRMVRGTFLLLLSVPVVTSLYLLCRVWWVLSLMERGGVNSDRNKSGHESVETLETLAQQTDNNGDRGENMENNNDSLKITKLGVGIISDEEKYFINQEKRTQMFLFSCLIVHVLCILPINIFKLALPSLKISFSTSTIDLIYIILLWVSFLPCTSVAPLYSMWARGNSDSSHNSSFIIRNINSKKVIAEKEHQRRMSDMRMEELNRRHSIMGNQSPLKSPQGSLMSHDKSAKTNDEYNSRSPQPGAKNGAEKVGGSSRQNSLVVAVQQRRASIISIGQQPHVSQENLLEVTSSHARSGSVRSSHSNHLVAAQPHTPHIVVENDRFDTVAQIPNSSSISRRKSYAPTHYGRNSSFRYREGGRNSPKKSRRHSIQPQPHPVRF